MQNKARNLLKQLRPALGMSVEYEGSAYKLIELLEDELAIVLEACHKFTDIQADQMGEAHRRVPRTIMIPVLVGENKEDINPAFLDLCLPLKLDI